MTDNPFFQHPSPLPNFVPPFEQIEEAHYLPAVERAIDLARARIEEIAASSKQPTFENTIVALETCSEELGAVTGVFYNQMLASGTDGLHELSEQIGPMNAAFSNDVLMNPQLFARIKDLWDRREELGLTVEQHTVLENSYEGFIRNGALLNEGDQKRFREISERLSVLLPTFAKNATKSAEAYEMVIEDEAGLAGLPESAIAAAKHMAEERGYEGKWLITLDYPSFIPFMQYAEDRAARETIWRAFSNRGFGDEFDNQQHILEIVRLRHERANLLGFETHAAYVLDRRMAATPETVLAFLDKLAKAYKPGAEKEFQQLKDYANKLDGVTDFSPWDVKFYEEKLKEELYHFHAEEVRPYFPLQKVLDGTFEHFSKLFRMSFKKADEKYPRWHEDVHVYDVIDSDTGDFIGTFYADFHPRTGKKQGAWETEYRSQGLYNGNVERPVVSIVCNFTKPTPDTPSLLTFDEVWTLFHEMGHAVHALLSQATYSSVSGTSVKHDFVELPSQLQENWCYEVETLAMISGHYETGEPLPQDLIEKLNNAKNFMAGWYGLRQVMLGTLDMAWHASSNPYEISDVCAFEDEAIKDLTFFPRYGGPTSTSFSHLFAGGYSSGYYGYKWAEVLDADAFEAFKENGLYDPETARAFKEEILARGGTEDPNVLYERFRGRAPDEHALLRREGLLSDKRKAA